MNSNSKRNEILQIISLFTEYFVTLLFDQGAYVHRWMWNEPGTKAVSSLPKISLSAEERLWMNARFLVQDSEGLDSSEAASTVSKSWVGSTSLGRISLGAGRANGLPNQNM